MTETTIDNQWQSRPGALNRGSAKSAVAKPRVRPWPIIFGVLLPLLVLVLEIVTGFCAGVFFDPVASIWHIPLVAAVPIINIFAVSALCSGEARHSLRLAMAGGFALAVSAYYTALFIPIMPMSVFALLAFGMGLLSLSAFLSLLATFSLVWRLGHRGDYGSRPLKRICMGILLGTLAITVLDGPRYIARAGLVMASSESESERRLGIALLRTAGSERSVLRACYEPRDWMMGGKDAAGWVASHLWTVDADDARQLYYRMTGAAFNSVPPPRMQSRGQSDFWEGQVFDEDQGGAAIGARVRGLELGSSRLDSHIDPISALAYTEWAMVFRNRATSASEARFQVALPPGGAVSRLTLWINGEPHEAAFGTKAQTRRAYESVVSRQRDPVLVTQSAPGRVLVQCFPVPTRGEMKIRFGVTAPLDKAGRAWLPAMVDRNFTVGRGFEHRVWAQTAGEELACGLSELHGSTPREGGQGLEGKVSSATLRGTDAWLSAGPVDPTVAVWANDRLGKPGAPQILIRRGSEIANPAVAEIVVVIDTSAGMRRHWGDVEDAIHLLAKSADITVVLAGDELKVGVGAGEISKLLARRRPVGGIDNSLALLRGIELAGGNPDVPLLWLHGAQPVLLVDRADVELALERRLARPTIYSLQLGTGTDKVSEFFWPLADVRPVPRGGSVPERVSDLLSGGEEIRFEYELLSPGVSAPEGVAKVWDHLVRHRVLTEVMAEIEDASGDQRADLAGRAARYQLVTPLSGAVVLERKSQFDAAGLKQLTAKDTPSVPVIPEPSSGLLALLGCMILSLRRRR